MPDLELFFSIEGDTQLIRRLEDVGRDFKDWTPEFNQIGQMLQKTFQDNFSSSGQLLGEPWAPLARATIIEKARHGYPPDILIRTGRMKKSFNYEVSVFQVVVSNTAPYFVYHQSNKPRERLPRRVMMKLDNKRKEIIVKIIQSAVTQKLQERGFNHVV